MRDGERHRHPGPFQADQIRSGDPYELSQGHPIYCLPTGTDGTGPNGLGFAVLDSDPAVVSAGVDTGIQLTNNTLRAPDVAVNFRKGAGTWAESAPLALEYAGRGQDEADLKLKIRELLAAGTRWVWVVRLVGPRRVEVHSADAAMRLVGADESLEAPGVLALPVPVRALFDRDAAHEVTLRNLLASKGYADLEALRQEGRGEGLKEGLAPLLRLFQRRLGRALSESERAAVALHLDRVGPDRLGDVVLDLAPAELAAWVADSDAR